MNKLNTVARARLSGESSEGSRLGDNAGGASLPERTVPMSWLGAVGRAGATCWEHDKELCGLSQEKQSPLRALCQQVKRRLGHVASSGHWKNLAFTQNEMESHWGFWAEWFGFQRVTWAAVLKWIIVGRGGEQRHGSQQFLEDTSDNNACKISNLAKVAVTSPPLLI